MGMGLRESTQFMEAMEGEQLWDPRSTYMQWTGKSGEKWWGLSNLLCFAYLTHFKEGNIVTHMDWREREITEKDTCSHSDHCWWGSEYRKGRKEKVPRLGCDDNRKSYDLITACAYVLWNRWFKNDLIITELQIWKCQNVSERYFPFIYIIFSSMVKNSIIFWTSIFWPAKLKCIWCNLKAFNKRHIIV